MTDHDYAAMARTAAEASAREAFEATSDWHSAKHEIRVAFPHVPGPSWPARFVRKGWSMSPIVAVTPQVNVAMADVQAAWLDAQPNQPDWGKAHQLARMREVAPREDGLVLFDEYMAITVFDPTDRAALSRAANEAGVRRLADAPRADPVTSRVKQQTREAAITAELPTAVVDAFLFQQLGYDPDEVARWAPSTRRPRRRAARGMIVAARIKDVRAMRMAGEQVSGADWRARVDAFIARAMIAPVK